MKEKHEYHSTLRQEQMERTREQILEGLVRTMARGIASLSIPAVAREAGVSVPTVYRYFRTKRELIEALGGYFVQKVGFGAAQLPNNPEELVALARTLFIRYGELDEVVRAAAMSELAYEFRKEGQPHRLKMIEHALTPVFPQFNEADRERLRNVILILTSTATIRAFQNYLGLSGEAAAENVAWAIRTLTSATSQPADTTQ